MGEPPDIYPNLSDQPQFRFNKINKIDNYFFTGICERKQ